MVPVTGKVQLHLRRLWTGDKGAGQPVLMFHGKLDRNVTYSHATLMADKLKSAGKSVDLVTYENLDHGLIDSAARTEMLAKSDAFLRASMKLPSQ